MWQGKVKKLIFFTDRRFDDKEDVTMENWTQEKLQQVVDEKHAQDVAHNGRQAITCKYFIEAVESKKYGWFWECPNGGNKCPYRHALPPGYVLKSEKKKTAEEEEAEKTPLEEIIEDERKNLTTRTPVTKELFLAWKANREKSKREEQEKAIEKRKADIKSGKIQMSGREIFMQNPELFIDDDEAAGVEVFTPEFKLNETVLTVTGTSITAVKKDNDKEKEKVGEEEPKDDADTLENQISEQEINSFGIQLGATEEDLLAALPSETFDESLFTDPVIEEVTTTEEEDGAETEGTPLQEVSEKYGENGHPED